MTTKEDLRPKEWERVKDVVEAAGLPTTAWGDDYNNRHENEKWCFGTPEGPNLGFVWWNNLYEEGGRIYFVNDAKDWEDQFRRQKRVQRAEKAKGFDLLVNRCFLKKLPMRVAIVSGKGFNSDHEKVERRVLDEVPWYPHHIDHSTGHIVVVRGEPQPAGFDPSADLLGLPQDFAAMPDERHEAEMPEPSPAEQPQHEAAPEAPQSPQEPTQDPEPSKPEVRESLTTAFVRDSAVVKAVKLRASHGKCECCGKQGFKTARGGYYLEVHHVIPLECDGFDAVWNALAICPDEHKQAHFGANRKELRDKMIGVLAELYPERLAQLQDMAGQMDLDAQATEDLEADIGT